MDSGLLGGRKKAKSPTGKAAAAFTLVAAILFVVALATPAMIHSSLDLTVANLKTDFGPFQLTYQVADSDKDTEDIDGHCQYTLTILDQSQPVDVVDNCDKLNAARGFLVLAAMAAIVAFMTQTCVACTATKNRLLRGCAGFFGVVAALCGLISMALWADLKNSDKAFADPATSSYLYGFWMLVVGWVLVGFASLPFLSA